ncbi:MAG TPA: AMP-binding protein, partial [Pyrinomonadaceae bacterium]|nr:AMP-binding protein [Pyrinomonadaceae bacterium]
LCARKITTEEKASLDLSSWTTAFNGSEPVRADTLERFSETFRSCGFRASAFYPCYGLAEATLFVSGSPEPRVPHVKTFAAEALEQNRVVEAGDTEARRLVSCGNTAPDQQLIIVSPETRNVCDPNEVGEIWVAGESVTAGYWKRPEETEETFGARPVEAGGSFLRTGDLGFIHEDELFITGRLKDLIIIRGRNLYPHDIERTVQESHPKLRSAAGAAFSISNGEERLVVVHEAERSAKYNYAEILSAIREVVAEEYEVQLYAVVIVKTGGVPRTSSGKIQRRACRELFLTNRLDVLAEWRESSAVQRETQSPALAVRPGHSIEEVEQWLCTQLAQKLGVDVSEIDLEKPITHYGIDSVATVELMHALETGLGVVVPFTSFYRSPNIREIARETAEQLRGHVDDQKIRPLNRLPRITTAIPRHSD